MERATNGGFPEPVAGEPIRLVRCRHDACGADTRVRLPGVVAAKAVRRVTCERCGQEYECAEEAVVDLGVEPRAPRAGVPGWLSDPQSPAWRYLSIPIAAAMVIGALVLIQGC